MKRRLALRSEYVAELTPNELTSVAGGATVVCLTGVYPTIDRPCPTVQGCFELAALPTVNTPCLTLEHCFTGTTTSPSLGC